MTLDFQLLTFASLLAIMLGRLRMGVGPCYRAFEDLIKSMYGYPDHESLGKQLQSLVKDQGQTQGSLFSQRSKYICRT